MAKAYIFPGQGAQYPGMASELYKNDERAKAMLEKANEILGFRITDLMFEGTKEDLARTEVTQPAVFLHSVAAHLVYADGTPDMVAGHSLGEFSALVACGALDFEDALKLVAARAQAMQKCCEKVPGTLAAVIGVPTPEVERICSEVTEGLVVPANYNCEGQLVISGTKDAVEAASARMLEAGALKVMPLNVSGAFHSPLMEPAREELAAAIEKTEFHKPVCPIYQNVSAKAETDPEVIKANLLLQLTSPVKWAQSVNTMIDDGAGAFYEFGPGTVLKNLVHRIARARKVELVLDNRQ